MNSLSLVRLTNLVALLAASSFAVSLQAESPAATPAASPDPEAIRVGPTETLALTLTAKGVQIYECRAKKDDSTQFEWVFKSPEAELFNTAGKSFGKHYAGPTWESSNGNKVMAKVKGKTSSPDPTAIDWLLLDTTTGEGSGILSRIKSIQRVATTGGKAPDGGCQATDSGKELRVPYTATYKFYEAKP